MTSPVDWRAAARLGKEELILQPSPQQPPGGPGGSHWQPLASGDEALDQLWRLGQPTEAWESWRLRRGGTPPTESADLLVEGRLRQGVGDDWTGLGQLEKAALSLKPEAERIDKVQRGLRLQLEQAPELLWASESRLTQNTRHGCLYCSFP